MVKPFSANKLRWLKSSVFLICLIPIASLVFNVFTGALSGDIIEFITHDTGEWGLRFLLLTLCITPLRKLFSFPDLIKFRRMLGLYAFFYICCHLLIYLIFDHFFDFAAVWEDIIERKYIFAGMTGFMLMIPLAITSTNGWIKRLGGKRWQKLHKLVYFVAITAVVHFIWQVKADYSEAIIYAVILTILLLYRHFTIGLFLKK